MRKPTPLTREQAWHYALRLLNQRNYTVHRLSEKLRQRGTQEADIVSIIKELQYQQLLDDARYAELFIRTESVYRHSSQRRISDKLRARGIDQTLIQQQINAHGNEAQETENVRLLAERYAKRLSGLPRYEAKQKLIAYLLRKGFPSALVIRVTKEQSTE